jgi:hypothetical protein
VKTRDDRSRYLEHDGHRQLDDQVDEVKRMLNSFLQKLSEPLMANRSGGDAPLPTCLVPDPPA